jgi:Arc/MetJ-type ribon-helix-helix transcriptional regulator
MGTLTLRIPDELERALERQSAQRGISKSDLVREALQRTLRVGQFRVVRAKAVPLAEARGIFTDEDVFRVIGDEPTS